jgi:riboflavin kinase
MSEIRASLDAHLLSTLVNKQLLMPPLTAMRGSLSMLLTAMTTTLLMTAVTMTLLLLPSAMAWTRPLAHSRHKSSQSLMRFGRPASPAPPTSLCSAQGQSVSSSLKSSSSATSLSSTTSSYLTEWIDSLTAHHDASSTPLSVLQLGGSPSPLIDTSALDWTLATDSPQQQGSVRTISLQDAQSMDASAVRGVVVAVAVADVQAGGGETDSAIDSVLRHVMKSGEMLLGSNSTSSTGPSDILFVTDSSSSTSDASASTWQSLRLRYWDMPLALQSSSSSSSSLPPADGWHACKLVRARLLDKTLRVRGRVAHGYGRGGAKLGFPTANLLSSTFASALESLETGVYCGFASIEDNSTSAVAHVHPAVVNIGYSPTFAGQENAEKIIEAHLIADKLAPFYGSVMRLQLHGRVRPEIKFGDFGALVAQIRADVRDVGDLLQRSPYAEYGGDVFLRGSVDEATAGGTRVSDDASWEWVDGRELWKSLCEGR